MIPIIGLVIGVTAGIYSGFSIPYGYSAYVAVGILACMDSVLGGVYANTQKEFEAKVFRPDRKSTRLNSSHMA